MNNKRADVLAFSPHPHDAEWGMGGTIARWTREGKEIVFVVCTNGEKGSMDPNLKPSELSEIREREQKEAAELLGVKEVVFLRHPDLALEATPEFKKEIIRLILTYRPEIVATRDPYQGRYISNPDHRVCGHAVLDAVWPYVLSPNLYPDLLQEGLQVHRVKEVLLWTPEQPNYRLDITNTYETKMAALRIHKSQIFDIATDMGGFEQGQQAFFKMQADRNMASAEGTEHKFAEAFVRIKVPPRL